MEPVPAIYDVEFWEEMKAAQEHDEAEEVERVRRWLDRDES